MKVMSEKWEQIESLIEKYPDLPPEAIFKEDLLTKVISFSEDALKVASGFKPKAYFIFSFDLVSIEEMKNRENLRAPEEICLVGGQKKLSPCHCFRASQSEFPLSSRYQR